MMSVNKHLSDVAAMKDEHAKLKQELADLRGRLNGPPQPQPSTSFYGGPPPGAAPPPGMTAPPSSRVKLVNTYFADMAAVINGVTHVLPPGGEKTITYPPGNITFQVMMVADIPQTRALA